MLVNVMLVIVIMLVTVMLFVQVQLQNVLSEMEKKDDLLQRSQHVIEKQEHELHDYQEELSVTERQNRLLRHSIDFLGTDLPSNR